MTDLVEKALESVDNTPEKIKNFTKLALTSSAEKVVELWHGELARRLLIAQDALPLIYCCNDVLQESKGKDNEAYQESFAEILEEDLRSIVKEQPAAIEGTRKVLNVWSERQVYGKSFLRRLRDCLRGEDGKHLKRHRVKRPLRLTGKKLFLRC